jgi:TonB-linked SusC/RagA family outer membrane protein
LLDTAPSMNIRGTGTIGSGSTAQPLVLIDGAEGNLEYINPQDIENISVLKDAAASSIYGSRAPFGVILVTTKRGKSGQTNVNYNNNFRWSAPISRPDIMDSYTFATFVNDACVNSNTSPWVTDERLQRIKDYVEGNITTVSIVDSNNPQYWANGNSFGNANVDAYDFYYKDWSFSQEHNVSASGGNDKFTFYTSVGFLDQNGLLDVAEDHYQKFTPMGKIDAQVTSWLKLNYTTRFIRTDYNRPTSLSSGMYANWARQNWPILPTHDDNGYIYRGNPLLVLVEGGESYDQTDNFNNHGSITIDPIKNWVTTVDFNYNVESYNQHKVSLKTYNHDVNGDPYVNRQTSSVSNKWWKNNYLNLNIYSTYDFKLYQQHNFKLMMGLQFEDLKYSTFGLSRAGVIVDNLPVVDLTSGLNYDGSAAMPSVNGSMKEWNTAGYFGRINYDYQGKYLTEANLRYDGSSRFRSDKRWNWFPSFSLGWNIAREGFWEDYTDKVNLLKLRGSFGSLGNQYTDNWYPTYQVLSVSSNAGTWLQNGVKPNVAYSPSLISSTLTWEKINTWDVGIDLGALKNRLTASFDYYVRKTLDMVGPAIELPNILGASVPKSNNTDLKTYGFELEVDWRDRLQNGLSYGVKFILSDYQTEITKYPNATNSLSSHYRGKKLGEIWGYETIGIAKSEEDMQNHLESLPNGGQNAFGSQWSAGDIMYKDTNGDGLVSAGSNTLNDPGDQRIIGNSTPRFQFGLDLNTSWKGFDARIFLQGVAKRDYWNGTPAFWGSNRSNMWFIIGLTDHVDYFRETDSNHLSANIDSYYPRPLLSDKNQKPQTGYLQNAAFIRLKNISVGYTLPQHISNRFYVKNMRLFFSGENLWTGTRLAKMFDPEGINGNNSESGIGYPLYKTVSFGLNVTL